MLVCKRIRFLTARAAILAMAWAAILVPESSGAQALRLPPLAKAAPFLYSEVIVVRIPETPNGYLWVVLDLSGTTELFRAKNLILQDAVPTLFEGRPALSGTLAEVQKMDLREWEWRRFSHGVTSEPEEWVHLNQDGLVFALE